MGGGGDGEGGGGRTVGGKATGVLLPQITKPPRLMEKSDDHAKVCPAFIKALAGPTVPLYHVPLSRTKS